MIIKELNFVITEKNQADFVVRVGEKIKVKVRVSGEQKEEILNGEIRGAYLGADNEYRIAIFGKYENQIAITEPSLHEIYLLFIRDWEYPIEE